MAVTRTETKYRITTVHPTGYMDGTHEFTVVRITHNMGTDTSVRATGFGCSRDYLTKSDTVAVNNFLTENGMRAVKMEKVKN